MTGRCPLPVDLSRAMTAGNDQQLRKHLRECAKCAETWSAYARISDAARNLPVVEPSLEQLETLRGALLAAARSPSAVPPVARKAWIGVALCTAGALLFLGVRLLGGMPAPAIATYRGAIHAHDKASFVRIGSAPDEIVRLTQGTITVEVAPLQSGERFRVITDDGEVEVHGTAFDVSAADDHLRAVRVLHGRVEVRPVRDAMVVLGPEERWEAKTAPAVTPAPTPVPVPTPMPMPALAPTAAPQPSATNVSARIPEPTMPPMPSIGASRHVAPKRAIEIFFQEGWSALSANDPKRAAEAFHRAARSAPSDPLAEDAWFWGGAALARTGMTGAAIDSLKTFIARYPRSPHASEASAMLGWLLLDAGDLEGAEARFRAAADDPAELVRASATKGLATAAQRRALRLSK